MKCNTRWTIVGIVSLTIANFTGHALICRADEPTPLKTLTDQPNRSKLHDAALLVRGDSGRWQDIERWCHSTTPPAKPAGGRFALDDWLDAATVKQFTPTGDDDNWLLFSTRQLNDNDRVWVERIERQGNRIKVVVSQATWRGKYFKNFTVFHVIGVNLGRLEPGTYEATCVVMPTIFTRFDRISQQADNWPADASPVDHKPIELSASFSVVKAAR